MDEDNSCVKKTFKFDRDVNLVQHITEPTHRSQHLLNYIIRDVELVNSSGVSDYVSDYLYARAVIRN